jgi:hypothetical protein
MTHKKATDLFSLILCVRSVKAMLDRRPLLSSGFADNENPYLGLLDKKGKVKWAAP